jgi:branched-chain amino acid transport system substrate-binding protein
VFAILAVGLAALTACGSRLPYSRLLADQRGAASGDVAGGSGVASDAGVSTGGVSQSAGQASSGLTSGAGAVSTGPGAQSSAQLAGSASGRNASQSAGRACVGPKSTIAIGSVGEQSGIAGAALADGPKAVSAWVASVNATQGGVSCHHLKYFIADDGADPARNQALTEQLVEQDHVIAFVQNDASLAGQGSESYLVSHNIPVVGSEGSLQFYNEHPNFFPESSAGNWLWWATYAGLADGLSPDQRAHVGVLSCVEDAGCSIAGQQAPAIFPQVGMNLVYNGKASLVTPDFTSQCQAAKQAGATVLVMAMDPNSMHRIGSSCAGVNYHPQYAAPSQVTIPDLATDPRLDGFMTIATVAPWTATNIAQVSAFQQVMRHYGAGIQLDGSSIQGWTSAQLFEAGTLNLPDQPTSQDIMNGMDKVTNNDLGGLTGQNARPEVCWFHVQLRNGQFSSPDNGKRGCR